MKRIALLVLVLLGGLFFAAGCGGGSSKSSTAQLRVVNAVADSAGFDYLVAGSTFATDVVFANASAYAPVTSGSQTIEVRNTGTSTDIINQPLSFTGGTNYTFVALGTTAQTSGVMLTDTSTAATSGNIELRIVDASAAQGNMDVYITAPGTNIYSVAATISGLTFGTASAYKTMASGQYEIRITAPGQKTALFDSGVLTYASGAVSTIVIEDTVGGTLPMTMQQLTDAAS